MEGVGTGGLLPGGECREPEAVAGVEVGVARAGGVAPDHGAPHHLGGETQDPAGHRLPGRGLTRLMLDRKRGRASRRRPPGRRPGPLGPCATTHLEEKHSETDAAPVQAAQAAELLEVLQVTTPPERALIVVGDTNSSPVDPLIFGSIPTPYMQFVAAGYTDAWRRRPGKVPGVSCCQLADLSNHKSVLSERIDLVFSRDVPTTVKQARVVGATVSDKTPPPGRGLWPSDHGAVIAELQFPEDDVLLAQQGPPR